MEKGPKCDNDTSSSKASEQSQKETNQNGGKLKVNSSKELGSLENTDLELSTTSKGACELISPVSPKDDSAEDQECLRKTNEGSESQKQTNQNGVKLKVNYSKGRENLDKERGINEPTDLNITDSPTGTEDTPLVQDNPAIDLASKGLYPVHGLRRENVPPQYQSDKIWDLIIFYAAMTVRFIVHRNSENRPECFPGSNKPYPYSKNTNNKKTENEATERYGTGFIELSSKNTSVEVGICPCKDCKTNGRKDKKKFISIKIRASPHVIFDNIEAAEATAEFSFAYQTKDKEEIKLKEKISFTVLDVCGCSNGEKCEYMNNAWKRCYIDRCYVTCVSHDEWVFNNLPNMNAPDWTVFSTESSPYLGFIISHPRGYGKHISFGKLLRIEGFLSSRLSADKWHEFNKLVRYRSASSEDDHETNGTLTDRELRCMSLPQTESASKVIFNIVIHKDNEYWVKFPEKIEFRYRNETKVFDANTEFYVKRIDTYLENNYALRFVYDIPTDNGSSGAAVIICDKACMSHHPIHSGSLQKNVNVSSLCWAGCLMDGYVFINYW